MSVYENLLVNTNKVEFFQFLYAKYEAFDAIRPGGAGVDFADSQYDPYVTVTLAPSNGFVPVTNVTISGNTVLNVWIGALSHISVYEVVYYY